MKSLRCPSFSSCDGAHNARTPLLRQHARSRVAPVVKAEVRQSSLWGQFNFGSQGRSRSPSPSPPPSRQGPAADSGALGKRLLNLGPNATPSAIAAALVDVAKSKKRMQPVKASQKDSYSSGNGTGGGTSTNGRGSSDGMISVTQVDTMLHGLRQSLEEINKNRAQYISLLAERDAAISKLESQLASAQDRISELERKLEYANSAGQSESATVQALQARLEQAEALAADADARAEDMQLRAAMSEQRAIEFEAIAEEMDARATRAEARAATAEAKAMVTQELLQQQVDELEEAKTLAARLEAQVSQVVYQPPPQPVMPPPPAPRQSPPPRQPTPPRPVQEVVLSYRTGWRQVYIHYSADGKQWTQLPGQPMDNVGDYRVVRIPCQRMEFAINNGKNDWDSQGGQNYHITSPGTYRLEGGHLQRMG